MENQQVSEEYSEQVLIHLNTLEQLMTTSLRKVRKEIRYLLEQKKQPNLRASEFSSVKFALETVMKYPEFEEYLKQISESEESTQPV